jgi:RecB family endonuclease NucS
MSRSFSLYFRGHVKYNGRALGLLGPGNFLLLRSVSIHGGTLITPRNYMGAGTKMKGRISPGSGVLTFTRKKETIEVQISQIYFMEHMDQWSECDVRLRRTERELVQKLFWNWPDYFDITCFSIEMEVATEYGAIDLLGTEFDGTHHVIEVKRRKASVSDCGQLRKYVETVGGIGYLAAPEIGGKALDYLGKQGYEYIDVQFS